MRWRTCAAGAGIREGWEGWTVGRGIVVAVVDLRADAIVGVQVRDEDLPAGKWIFKSVVASAGKLAIHDIGTEHGREDHAGGKACCGGVVRPFGGLTRRGDDGS